MAFYRDTTVRNQAVVGGVLLRTPDVDPFEVLQEVTITCDGSCAPRSTKGCAWACVLRYGTHYREVSGVTLGEQTNQRAEILSCIAGFKLLKHRCRVLVRSDSTYLLTGLRWIDRWRAKGWKCANSDLWQQLGDLTSLHEVNTEWVAGHANDVDNIRCDTMAHDLFRKL